jgi:NADPH:quinone reductase-like Zn-dependent oxidoreductase
MLALVASPRSEERVELRTVEDPAPAPDETLVRVQAISLNRGEVHRLAAAEDGTRFGWDVAGTVERAAANGQGPEAGTRVVGFVYSGGWAERVAISNLKLAPIPDGVSFAAASTLPVAGLTALRTLRLGGFLLDRRVLVTGASGGVGRFAVQLAADAGAHVTAVSSSAERAEGLHEIGAAEIVGQIGEAQGTYDLILESVGGDSLAEAVRLAAPAGTIVSFGNSARRPTTFDISPYYAKETRLVGFLLLSPLQHPDFRGDLGHLLDRMAAGKLDPQIGLEVSWHEAASALAALRARRVQGKAVLTLA